MSSNELIRKVVNMANRVGCALVASSDRKGTKRRGSLSGIGLVASRLRSGQKCDLM